MRGWGFSAVTTPVAGDGLLFAGGSGMGDPTEPDDPLFDWSKLIAAHDANQDGQIALVEMPKSVVWHIRKEIPIDVPGNGFPMHDLMAFFVDTDKNGIVTKAEWDASETFAKDVTEALVGGGDPIVPVQPHMRPTPEGSNRLFIGYPEAGSLRRVIYSQSITARRHELEEVAPHSDRDHGQPPRTDTVKLEA